MSEMERRLDELEFALAAWVKQPNRDDLWRMLLDHVDDRELKRQPNPVSDAFNLGVKVGIRRTQRTPPPAGGG